LAVKRRRGAKEKLLESRAAEQWVLVAKRSFFLVLKRRGGFSVVKRGCLWSSREGEGCSFGGPEQGSLCFGRREEGGVLVVKVFGGHEQGSLSFGHQEEGVFFGRREKGLVFWSSREGVPVFWSSSEGCGVVLKRRGPCFVSSRECSLLFSPEEKGSFWVVNAKVVFLKKIIKQKIN